VRVDKDTYRIVEDEYLDGVTVDELAESLPDTACRCAPRMLWLRQCTRGRPHTRAYTCRYIVFSYRYEQKDGRVSYPLLFIYYSPLGPWPCLSLSVLARARVLWQNPRPPPPPLPCACV
jgi:hypothetical protein